MNEFVKFLLENGADPYQKCNDGFSTLEMCNFKPEIKALIFKNYRKNVKEEKKNSTNEHRNCGGCGMWKECRR